MPWRPLPRIAFAVATYPFQPSAPADLPLELGDELYIIEEGGRDGQWLRGYLVAPPSLLAGLTSVRGQTLEARVFSGIFPRSCVEVRELLGPTGAEELLAAGYGVNGSAEGEGTQAAEEKSNWPTRTSSRRRSGPLASKRGSGESGRDAPSGVPPAAGINGARLVPQPPSARRSLGAGVSITPPPPQPPAAAARPPDAPRPPAPVPMLKIGDETPTSAAEPLIDEIASCLREWHSSKLHALLLARRYAELETLSGLVHRADLARRQLLHGVLTDRERAALRERTIWDLVRGNKLLAGEVVVRDPAQRGRLLTGTDDPVAVSRLQATMSLLDAPPELAPDRVNLHHLLLELREAPYAGRDCPALAAFLAVKRAGEPLRALTEAFAMDLPASDAAPSAAVAAAAAQRTLFTDLTGVDVGETGGADSELYLVVKARMNCAAQPVASAASRSGAPKESETSRQGAGSETSDSAGKGGRRSFMWSKSVRSGSQRHKNNLAVVTDESVTSKTSSEPELSPSESSKSDLSSKGVPAQLVKKDVGVGVLHLKKFLCQNHDSEHTLQLWTPAPSQEALDGGPGWEELLQGLLTSPSGHYAKLEALERVKVRLHAFVDPDADSLVRVTPTLLHNIARTPKIGFSGAPTRPRSDIYVTLQQAILPAQALFSHPDKGAVPLTQPGAGPAPDLHNLQLTLEVRRASGDRVESCIFPASNASGVTAWRTAAVPQGGVWAQTIRLAIPQDQVPDCHLIMSLADAPGFPFALCWIPLWQRGAFVADGAHAPLLHLYDKTTSSVTHGRGAYLDLPWDSKAGGRGNTGVDGANGATSSIGRESWSSHMAHLQLATYLCSTAFSQDHTLLRLLKWRECADDELLVLLRQLSFVPEIELVKLVQDVLDALFAILVDRSGSDEHEDLVFAALVTVLGIVHDRRFNLDPLVNEYATTRFNFPFATPCLVRGFLRLLTRRGADYAHARQLRATFKVGRQLMRFIVVARTQQQAKEAGIGITNTAPVFVKDFRKIFQALQAQMRDASPQLVGSKTLIVQHLHAWLPELMPVFAPAEILDIAVGFLDACAGVQGKLVLHTLVLIYNLAKAIKALDADLQERFNAHVERWIAPYWGATDNPNEQYREQVRLCCSILTLRDGDYGAQFVAYYTKILESYRALRHAPRPESQTLSFLFPSAYPFPSKPTKEPRTYDENLIELVALKATISADQLTEHADKAHDLATICSEALEVNMSILEGEAFPSSWLTLHVYHHRILLTMLDGMARIMTKELLPPPEDADDFNTALWKQLQMAILKLVRSEALALETLPEQKRRAVWKIAGDIREQGAELLGRVWDALGWDTDPEEKRQYGLNRLGGYQVQYVPSLVGPIVELCLSVHEGLRGVAVEILQSMIISEWTLNEDLAVVQAEMIYSLDDLFRSNRRMGESAPQKLFVGQLVELFAPLAETAERELWEATADLVATVDRMLDLLAAVHAPDQGEAPRIVGTLRLMDFLKDMQKEDIFISYVHQLAEVEAAGRNFREAGLALGLHADLYAWDPQRRVAELKSPRFPRQTAFERKEALYFAMIGHFEEGGAWAPALACYRELATQYEHHAYDFAKLARTQRATARLFELIARGEGAASRYFRVAFSGLGFAAHLRGKTFIYEGSGADRLASFIDRLQQQHPACQLLAHAAAAADEHADAEGQFAHVTAVSPHRDLEHALYRRARVPLATKEYLTAERPQCFAVTSRRHSPKTGVRDSWVEKTLFRVAEPFPTILRRSEIVAEEVVALSPLETAVERTVRKTSELVLLERRVRQGDASSLFGMLEAVKTSVDPGSATSVAQYRDILPRFPSHDPAAASEPAEDEETEEAATEPKKPQLEPLEVALQTSLLDFTSGLKACLGLLAPTLSAAEHQGLVAAFQLTFGPELAALAPASGAAAALSAPSGAEPAEQRPELPQTPVAPKAPTTLQVNGDTAAAAPPTAHNQSAPLPAPPSEATRGSQRKRMSSLLRRHPSLSQPAAPALPPATNGTLASHDDDDGAAPAPIVGGGIEGRSVTSSGRASAAAPSSVAPTRQLSRKGSDAAAAAAAAARATEAARSATPSAGPAGSTTLASPAGSLAKKHPGSIRKRLSSTLGLGRKPSRAVLTGNEQGTLEEEE